MPGVNQPITITVNDAEVRNALNALRGKMKGLRRPLGEIGRKMKISTYQRFVDSKDPDGRDWSPNSLLTKMNWAKEMGRSVSEKKPLVWHNHLRDTLRYQASAFELLVGTNQEYAAIHQFGQGVPLRPFLGVSKQDRVDILEILFDHLNKP